MLIYREIGRAFFAPGSVEIMSSGLINHECDDLNRSVFRVHFLKVAAKVRLVYRHDHIVRLGGSNVYCFGTSREGSGVTLPMEILLV